MSVLCDIRMGIMSPSDTVAIRVKLFLVGWGEGVAKVMFQSSKWRFMHLWYKFGFSSLYDWGPMLIEK